MSYFKYLLTIIFILITITACSKNNLNEQSFRNSETHDLKDINDTAKKFVESDNAKNNTHWISLDADLRVLVYKCIVPLKAEWSIAHDYSSPSDKKYLYIKVICEKSTHNDKSWDVLVPTNKPNK